MSGPTAPPIRSCGSRPFYGGRRWLPVWAVRSQGLPTGRETIWIGLCAALEQGAKEESVTRMTVHASITARGFFEKRGWHVVKEQQVERKGVLLTNFVMEKVL